MVVVELCCWLWLLSVDWHVKLKSWPLTWTHKPWHFCKNMFVRYCFCQLPSVQSLLFLERSADESMEGRKLWAPAISLRMLFWDKQDWQKFCPKAQLICWGLYEARNIHFGSPLPLHQFYKPLAIPGSSRSIGVILLKTPKSEITLC